MKVIIGILLIVVMLLFAIITSVLAAYKDIVWECIEFKKEGDEHEKNN